MMYEGGEYEIRLYRPRSYRTRCPADAVSKSIVDNFAEKLATVAVWQDLYAIQTLSQTESLPPAAAS